MTTSHHTSSRTARVHLLPAVKRGAPFVGLLCLLTAIAIAWHWIIGMAVGALP